MKRLLLTTLLLVVAGALVTTQAVAEGRGANPKGKPFVELQGQIIEVEGEMTSLHDQIDSIVARVDTMEDRIGANEAAIADLAAQSQTLQDQIDANATDIATLEADIADLEAQNADLQAQIDANSGDIAAHQDQIDFNLGLIDALQISLSDLGTSLQEQIDHNADLIAALQAEIEVLNDLLALKALLDNSECPGGYAMREVLPDGSVVCEDTSGGGAAGIQATHVWSYYQYIYPGYSRSFSVYCPGGWIATGASHYASYGVVLTRGYPLGSSGWYQVLTNTGSYPQYAYSTVRCIRLY